MKPVIPTLALFLLAAPLAALAQNPIQWSGNARGAMDRAAEQQLPIMFWVTEARDVGDDNDLRDAQTESFRDPIVAAIAEHHFVPVRVSRNSRMLGEAERLGLPTSHGLYVALVTSDGRVLDLIDPLQVADPQAFALRLTAAFRAYRDGLYKDTLRSIVTSPESAKADVRRAVQTIWRLNILSADQDLVRLLDRKDLLPIERQRLYGLLASFATKPSIDALLSRAAAGDRDAAKALGSAEAGALEFLVPQLPTPDSATSTQMAAYDAAARIARISSARPATFWTTAKPEERARELDALRTRAASVLEYWQERFGRWR
jgi:hypothetical protein